jgi:tryptophanyl-tRNA synthetase
MGAADDTARRISRIVTDSTPPEAPKDPDGDTLVTLLRVFADDATTRSIETRYREGGIGYGEVKGVLAEAVEAHVAPLRRRYEELLADPAELDARLAADEAQAAQRAEEVVERAMAAMGL